MVLDAATNTTTVTGKLRHFSFVDLEAPEDVKLPHVEMTKLPNEMMVNASQGIVVRADRSSSPSWIGDFTFEDEAGSDPLIFAGVGPEPIDVGSFTADVPPTLTLEAEVGTYTCADAGTGRYNPRVYFSYTVSEASLGLGFIPLPGSDIVPVAYTFDATVACVHVLGLAPTVTSTSPVDGATNVPTNAVITATFSEPMDPTTFEPIQRVDGTYSAFFLRDPDGNLVPANVSLSSDGFMATLSPQSALAPNTPYTATVLGSVVGAKDSAGTALASDETWTFTTGAPAGGGNTASLSNATGNIQNGQATPTCQVIPNPTGTEAAVLCDGGVTGLFLATYP